MPGGCPAALAVVLAALRCTRTPRARCCAEGLPHQLLAGVAVRPFSSVGAGPRPAPAGTVVPQGRQPPTPSLRSPRLTPFPPPCLSIHIRCLPATGAGRAWGNTAPQASRPCSARMWPTVPLCSMYHYAHCAHCAHCAIALTAPLCSLCALRSQFSLCSLRRCTHCAAALTAPLPSAHVYCAAALTAPLPSARVDCAAALTAPTAPLSPISSIPWLWLTRRLCGRSAVVFARRALHCTRRSHATAAGAVGAGRRQGPGGGAACVVAAVHVAGGAAQQQRGGRPAGACSGVGRGGGRRCSAPWRLQIREGLCAGEGG